MQAGLRGAALGHRDVTEVEHSQRAAEQRWGLREGEQPPGFRVIGDYARSIMGRKDLYPPPPNVTEEDAFVATLLFDAGGVGGDGGKGGGR